MPNFLTFNSSFLDSIVFSIKKRQKAIKYKVTVYSQKRVIEKTESVIREKLELEFRLLLNQTTLRFYFWEDRLTWIDIRESSKTGWVFEWNLEGRIGSTDAKAILIAIEQSTEFAVWQNKINMSEKLDNSWKPILLAGPRLA